MANFNSKKELDDLFDIMSTAGSTKPSEVIEFYNEVENLLINIYIKGYKKGVQINNQLTNIINPKKDGKN